MYTFCLQHCACSATGPLFAGRSPKTKCAKKLRGAQLFKLTTFVRVQLLVLGTHCLVALGTVVRKPFCMAECIP